MASQSRWIIVAALAAVVLVAVVVLETQNSDVIAYSINMKLLIAIANQYSNRTSTVGILNDVGVPGGIFATTRYSSYGVNGFYPVWARHYSTRLYVDSKVVRDYTLGDFFEVWGEPLGPFNTLGYRANITAVNPFAWTMCLMDPGPATGNVYQAFDWGSHVLRNNETITLVFSSTNEPCA